MKKNFYVAQTSINDCGYACLAMIFNLKKVKFNKSYLKNELVRGKKVVVLMILSKHQESMD